VEAVFSLIGVVRIYADGVACGDALKKAEHPTPCIAPPMNPGLGTSGDLALYLRLDRKWQTA
jgi:hypothetical protein